MKNLKLFLATGITTCLCLNGLATNCNSTAGRGQDIFKKAKETCMSQQCKTAVDRAKTKSTGVSQKKVADAVNKQSGK
jgi:hypothetical protein